MSTLQEAMKKSGLAQVIRECSEQSRELRDLDDRLRHVLRSIEDKIRQVPGACTKVVTVPFPHPDYDDPHELAWSSRRGKWRLVLRWEDGADPVLCCSRSVRAAVLGSDELRVLLAKLGVT